MNGKNKRIESCYEQAYEEGYKACTNQILPNHSPYYKPKQIDLNSSWLDGWSDSFLDNLNAWF